MPFSSYIIKICNIIIPVRTANIRLGKHNYCWVYGVDDFHFNVRGFL